MVSAAGEISRNAWTISGTVVGTDQVIEVVVLESRSVGDLARGDQWPTRIVVSKWDSLYNRLAANELPAM